MRYSSVLLVVLILALASGPALADTLHLKSGKSYEGKVISESGGKVKFKTSSGIVMEIDKSDVDRIEKGRTKGDEFTDRLAELQEDDLDGMLELARWCHENRLFRQKKQVLRTILKKCPDHPETRQEQGQVWSQGKWKSAPDDLEEPRVEGGGKLEVKDAAAALVAPKGWSVKTEGKTVTATGPDRYKQPPVLSITFGAPGGDPAAAFPEKEGWEKPVDATASGLRGLVSKRIVTKDHIALVERVAVLRDKRTGLKVRLTCLRLEGDAYFTSLDLVLKTLAIEPPPADYTNKHYGYACDLPEGAGWKSQEDEGHDLHILFNGPAQTDWGLFMLIAGKTNDEKDKVRKYFDELIQDMKSSGDVKKDGEIVLGGEKGRFLDGTTLFQGGIPARERIALVTHRNRVFLVIFVQHEFGQEKTKEAWDTVIGSFRFID